MNGTDSQKYATKKCWFEHDELQALDMHCGGHLVAPVSGFCENRAFEKELEDLQRLDVQQTSASSRSHRYDLMDIYNLEIAIDV